MNEAIEANRLDEVMPWHGDMLNRKVEAEFLERYLVSRSEAFAKSVKKEAYVVNLNAEWGAGKSFFLERFALQLQQSKHLVTTVNAWESDHAGDALAPLLGAFGDLMNDPKLVSSEINRNKEFLANFFSLGGLLTRTAADAGAPGTGALWDVAKKSLSRDPLSVFEARKVVLEDFCAALATIVEELEEFKSYKAPIFILVDELDRCRPDYAVQFLERIKHIFKVPGLVFVVATDSEQLAASIRGLYGAQYDAERYLYRFFDQTIRLEEPQTLNLIKQYSKQLRIDYSNTWCITKDDTDADRMSLLADIFEFFQLRARDIIRLLDRFDAILISWEDARPINLLYLLLLLVAEDQPHKFADLKLNLENRPSGARSLPQIIGMKSRHLNKQAEGFANLKYDELLIALFDGSNKSFMKIMNGATHTSAERLAIVYYEKDMSALRAANRRLDMDRSFPSLDQYPEIVRTAGRIGMSGLEPTN